MRRWWSPRHFSVAECEADPVPGGLFRILMEEPDGAATWQRAASSSFVNPRRSASNSGRSTETAWLFSAIHDVELAPRDGGTRLSLTIRVTDARPEAAPALAGMDLGWNQLLDNLAEHLRKVKGV
jgi:uncharacterized protein YndB with AHSA1/START domain